jgi:hypothetical protein
MGHLFFRGKSADLILETHEPDESSDSVFTVMDHFCGLRISCLYALDVLIRLAI